MATKLDWLPYGMLPAPIILKAWSDPKFKADLLNDPIGALTSEGYSFPKGTILNMHENSGQTFNLVLPEQPASLKSLAPDELEKQLALGTKCAASGTCD